MNKQISNFFFVVVTLLFALPTIAQSTASKNVSTFIINSPQLDTLKKIWVYVPESYKTETKKYPVLYLQDAQNLFDASTSYVGEWKVDEVLDSLKFEFMLGVIVHGN